MKYKKKYPAWVISLLESSIITTDYLLKERVREEFGLRMKLMRLDKKTYESIKNRGTIGVNYNAIPKIELPEIKKEDFKFLNYGINIKQPSLIFSGVTA